MKKMVAVFVFLALALIAAGQDEPKYIAQFNKGIGDAIYPGITRDQAWAGILRTLMLGKFKILTAEKDAGIINSKKTASSWQAGIGVNERSLPGLDILIEEREGGIGIITNVIAGINWPTKERHKLEKKFYDKLAGLLYGPAISEKKGD